MKKQRSYEGKLPDQGFMFSLMESTAMNSLIFLVLDLRHPFARHVKRVNSLMG